MVAAIGVSISVGFSILLPVVPVLLERNGPPGTAGAATAALFAGAVVGEICTPWLMSWWSPSRLLIAGQFLTGLLSLVYVLPHATAWQMLGAAGIRGLGMGVAIVVCVVLVEENSAPDRRGRSIGLFGLALSAPAIALPSVGVALLTNGHAEVTALIAFIGGLVGGLVASRLPSRTVAMAGVATSLLVALRQPGLFAVFAGFVLVSGSFGGVVTFAPVALAPDGLGSAAVFLLVAGITRASSRWLSGMLGDHQPARLVLLGGIVLTLVGLIALAVRGGPLMVLVAAIAYGTGFGTVQTGAYLAMTERGTTSHRRAISALWNSGIDLGASLGGVLLGLGAAQFGYAIAVWVLPAVVLVSLPLAAWPAARAPLSAPTDEDESPAVVPTNLS